MLLLNLIVMLSYISNQQRSNTSYGKQDEIYKGSSIDPPSVNVLDTCPLQIIDPLSPELLRFHTPEERNSKKHCKKYKPLTFVEGGYVHVRNDTAETSCTARCIYPKKDSNVIQGDFVELPSEKLFECDVIHTVCKKGNVPERYLHLQIFEDKGSSSTKKDLLPNVYILILDSVSNFMAKRSLPKTLEYLKEEHGAVQMEFLNKVGDNSRPNGFPLVFGKSVQKVGRVGRPADPPDWDNEKVCKEWLDKYPYHLNEYKKKGYKTMTAVDYSMGIIYYQVCKGLKRREADHLFRPFDLMSHSKELRATLYESTCGESHLYMLEYLEKFMNSYPGTPKIAQVWPTTLSHDGMGSLYHSDEQFLKFFNDNREAMENSFFFFLGDHGPRASGIEEVRLGRYENKNPFLVVSLPKNLRNTTAHEGLRAKSPQLMTHFDLHATLMDILHYQPQQQFLGTSSRSMQPFSKGSSLLREWNENRNCHTLPILFEYCLCQYERKNVTDRALREKLGSFLAKALNQELESKGYGNTCLKQTLKKAIDVQELQVGNNTLYSVYAMLKPSNGLFTAEIFSTPSGLELSSGFSRWGWYGGQGDCVLDPPRPLCHCPGK